MFVSWKKVRVNTETYNMGGKECDDASEVDIQKNGLDDVSIILRVNGVSEDCNWRHC